VTFADLLADLIARLDDAGVPYMVTGSLASSYHGQPRSTLDVDIVIDPDRNALDRLVDALVEGSYYVDRDVASQALDERTQFNAIGRDALKVDFIIRKERAFSVTEFARREPADLLGTDGFVATAEDVVLSKLEWAAQSGSDRQVRDAAGIVAVDEALDRTYIARWAVVLGVSEAWRSIVDGDLGTH
jgi:hypothetical protein